MALQIELKHGHIVQYALMSYFLISVSVFLRFKYYKSLHLLEFCCCRSLYNAYSVVRFSISAQRFY